MRYDDWGWKPYVPVAERRRKAQREMEKQRKQGHAISPVVIQGRTIARTFWGKAWCDNLERYSDYANRLPRGRTYVRNGSVVDLQIQPGVIHAQVSGSSLYRVALKIAPVQKAQWDSIRADCAGSIESLVELLQGRLSKAVMERICRQRQGLFPSPSEIQLSCSCPDWAAMCKHVAAALYGAGARLDQQPELLFMLRGVDETELIAVTAEGTSLSKHGATAGRVLGGEDLSALFGLDLAGGGAAGEALAPPDKRAPGARRATLKVAAKRVQAGKSATAKQAGAAKADAKASTAKQTVKKTAGVRATAAQKVTASKTAAKKTAAPKTAGQA